MLRGRLVAVPMMLLVSLLLAPRIARADGSEAPLVYPTTSKVDKVDDYHGTDVADPYRWLEDDVRESQAVKDWVEAENAVTMPYLESIAARGPIVERLRQLWNYERYSSPFKAGGKYFYFKNDGLQNQSVMYMIAAGKDPVVVLDPNSWSADGTVALAGLSISDDGRYLAHSKSAGGSDWQDWYVLNLETGEMMPDHLQWTKFTGASWTADGKGFFYSRWPEPAEGQAFQQLNKYNKVYYHRVGTPQSEDVLVFHRPDEPDWGFAGQVTEDGRWLVISVWKGTDPKNRVLYKDLTESYGMPVDLIDSFDNEFSLIGNDGSLFYFMTDVDAPMKRVITIDIRKPARENWREVIPQTAEPLTNVNFTGNLLVASYLKDATSFIRMFRPDGSHVRDVTLPGPGSAGGFGGRQTDSETFYTFTSINMPPSIYRYDMITGDSSLWREAQFGIDTSNYEVKQVFYASKDGTKVPMFIAHRKGMKLDGKRPTLLYGYGGFNVSLTPSFSITRMAWMEMGGVFAMANLRGGGEYGEAWHQGGTKLNKQNVFDDFIAAAEYLIAQKYTSPERLAIQGGSNGGLLVGAALTQRPDLFGAALPAVGVMDMLRFHQFTAGRYWVDDYGSADDPAQFQALRAYSPYHNIKDGAKYPATLITTADHDDRVVPGHSFKFAARLQEAQAGDAPVLIRIETSAGHGAGKPTEKQIQEVADQWAFLVENLDFPLPEMYGTQAKTKPAAAPATAGGGR